MKKILLLAVCLLMLAGCGTKTIPDWIKTSHAHLENYKNNFLLGRDRHAEINFRKAVAEIKTSGDLKLLQMAYLTSYALQTAVLDSFDDADYRQAAAVEEHPENSNYLAFLKGDFALLDDKSLPPQYGPFLRACKSGKQAEIDAAIAAIEDPLSRLIASGVAVKKNLHTETTLATAVRTASERGWKKPLLVYLNRLEEFYIARGEEQKATQIKRRIEIIR